MAQNVIKMKKLMTLHSLFTRNNELLPAKQSNEILLVMLLFSVKWILQSIKWLRVLTSKQKVKVLNKINSEVKSNSISSCTKYSL